MEQGKNNILRRAYSYLGRDWCRGNGKYLAIYTGTKLTENDELHIRMTAMEAFREGWSVITNGIYPTMRIVMEEALRVDGCVWHVSYDDVNRRRIGEAERELFALNGGILSPVRLGESFSQENVRKGDELMSLMADACIFVNYIPHGALTTMLDNGVECSVLRSGLRERTAREAVFSGLPVIDSFSSWLPAPGVISWEGEEGELNLLIW